MYRACELKDETYKKTRTLHFSEIRADFREGDEDSSFSVFRVRRFSEWPEPLHWIAFPVEILTKPLIHWIASPLFTENPFFHWKVLRRIPFPKNRLWHKKPCPLPKSGVAPANQTKGRFKTKSSWISPFFLWILVFFLGKTSTIHISKFCSGMPPWKVHGLTFVWFGLPGPLLTKGPCRTTQDWAALNGRD